MECEKSGLALVLESAARGVRPVRHKVPTTETPALAIRELRKTYANGQVALHGIDLDVATGDFFALLGPNGAGKSTVIGIISSLVRKSHGAVSIFGIDIDRDFSAAKRHLGLVPQEINFSQFETVHEIVLNQAGYYGIPRRAALARAARWLTALGLWERRQTVSRTLSGGMKRRLMIARALMHEPRLLILDEPTAGVDIEARRAMWDFLVELNNQGTTIILTTHYLEEAERLCRNIAIIDEGAIIEHSTMRALLAKLQRETLILDCAHEVPAGLSLTDLDWRRLDHHTLEVDVAAGQPLNAVFATLSAAGVVIASMRNKSNRLEELFLRLVSESDGDD